MRNSRAETSRARTSSGRTELVPRALFSMTSHHSASSPQTAAESLTLSRPTRSKSGRTKRIQARPTPRRARPRSFLARQGRASVWSLCMSRPGCLAPRPDSARSAPINSTPRARCGSDIPRKRRPRNRIGPTTEPRGCENSRHNLVSTTTTRDCSSTAEHRASNAGMTGSIPASRSNFSPNKKPRRCNAEAQRRKQTMDTNSKPTGQVKRLVLDIAEVTL